jgi:halimadienyl-diphosphate synthase
VPDADDTAVSLSLFTTYRDALGTDIFELYETPDYFQTLVYERNPSVTANAHVLNALKRYPSNADRRRMILKIVRYLESAQVDGAYWNDKWHASAFYATDRAMLALAGVSERAVRPAVEWILDQQHENGAWGYQGGTQEETAWAIHALTAASDRDAAVKALADDAISRGATYLSAGFKDTDYPALWIGKGLYATPKVTRAVIVGALARARGRRL